MNGLSEAKYSYPANMSSVKRYDGKCAVFVHWTSLFLVIICVMMNIITFGQWIDIHQTQPMIARNIIRCRYALVEEFIFIWLNLT